MDNYKKIYNLDKLKSGDHTVLLYKEINEILSASVSFIKTSLKRNEKCLYIKGDLNIEALLNALRKEVSDLDLYIENGQLQFLTKEETYALSDKFKAKEMIETLKKESAKALEEGYQGLAITGELSWVLNFEGGKKEIIDYEWMLNEYIFDDYPVVAMCRYNLNKFDKNIIKAIIELHHFVVWQGKIHENPYYITPAGYRDNRIVEYEIESWLKNIQEYEKRESVFKEKIKEKENKYQNLFNSAPIGIVTTTSKGKAVKINKTMVEILGFDSIDKTLNHYPDLFDDLYVNSERRKEFMRILKENGQVKAFDLKAIKKDGSHIWLSTNAKISSYCKDYFMIEAFVFDITARKNRENKIREQKEELSASNEQLTAYNEEIIAMNEELEQSFEEIDLLNLRFVKMIELLSNMTDEKLLNKKEFLEALLNKAIRIIPEADYGSVYIYKKGKVEFINTIGYELSSLKDLYIPEKAFFNINDNIEIIDSSEVKKRNKKYMDQNNYKKLKKLSYKMKEIMYMDLEIEGQKKAGLSMDISEKNSNNFTNNSLIIFKAFHIIASSFYKIKEYNNLQNSFTKELITSIVKIMEMYDLYTKDHSENVAKTSAVIAKEMNLSNDKIRETYWAGLVHDIGKLLIPLNIINKKEKLTDKEYELIKKHPVWGNKALSSSETLKPISKYILHHHERWDGKGYPEGLKEEEIPVISQIIGVADAWDAMLSKRAYRNSLSFEKALAEIKRNRGSQFSPLVADNFIKILEDDKIEQLKVDVLNNDIDKSNKENHILKRKEEYEELFEKAEEGIVIVDQDFSVIKANNYFLDLFGYDKTKIMGENIKKIVPESRTEETDNYIRKLAQGENVSSRTIRKKENGEMINVSIQSFPVSLGEENMGYYIIYRDISELEETKSKYENIKNRYKALFENERTVMLIIDPDNGEIVDANPAAVNFYGWSKEKITSMKITEINVLNKEEVKKEMEVARSKNKNYFNFKHHTADNKLKNVEVYSQPIPFAEKEYLYSIIHEIRSGDIDE